MAKSKGQDAGQVERVAVADLIPYARNARTHTDEQVAQVAASIREFGFLNPILIAGDNTVIAGHARLMAARKLGMTDVPCIRWDHLTEAQRRAYTLADNKLALNAGWDDEMLLLELEELRDLDVDLDLTGFTAEEIDGLAELGGGAADTGEALEDDEQPEMREDPKVQRGQVWLLGRHRLMCGDSTAAADVRRLMAGQRAQLFATDPPYLVGYDACNHPNIDPKENKDCSDTYRFEWDESDESCKLYVDFIAVAMAEAIDKTAPWYCWHADARTAKIREIWKQAGALVHQQIIWVKSRPILTYSTYMWAHEPCLMGWVKGNRPKHKDGQPYLSTVWQLGSTTAEERPEHPTPKPLECFAIPMRQHTNPGDICYEPFCGGGSQLIAAEKIGRVCYAMEISPVYCAVILDRWAAATGKDPVLEGGDGATWSQFAGDCEVE